MAFFYELQDWWISMQPAWRKPDGNDQYIDLLVRTPPSSTEETWESLNHSGKQGLFLLMVSLFWCASLAGPDSFHGHSHLGKFVADLTWVFDQLTLDP